MAKKTHLGRGLDALLSKKKPQAQTGVESNQPQDNVEKFEDLKNSDLMKNLPVEFLQRGKYQPRKDMSEAALDELADSIARQGVIQPVVVRNIGPSKYEIIAGERRWRASQRAGLSEIPCVIRNVPDEAAIAMSLVENIQREDLNAIEEAVALQRLMQEFELTHQETAEAVGKSRTTITNLLRLLKLTPETRTLVEHGDLEMGHARALLSLDESQQYPTAKTIVAKDLTVRETEKLIRSILNPKPKKKEDVDADTQRLEGRLSDHLGANVSLKHNKKGKGSLLIKYSSLDELDGILNHLGMEQE